MKKVLPILLGLFFTLLLNAQDYHFSQHFHTPLVTNAAQTGFMPADIRAGLIYRDQWRTVTSSAFSTFSAFVDAPINRQLESLANAQLGDDIAGLGLFITGDQTGEIKLQTMHAMLSMAYHKSLGNDQYVGIGFQPGIIYRGFNQENVNLPNEWRFNPLPPGYTGPATDPVVLDKASKMMFDLAVGMMYHGTFLNDKLDARGGFQLSHLTSPNESFIGNGDAGLPMKITVNAGADYRINRKIGVSPDLLIGMQNGANFINVGGAVSYYLNPDLANQIELFAGGYYRHNDAAIIMIGGEMKSIRLGISYDYNFSSLSKASSGVGAFEFGMTYMKRIRKIVPPTTTWPCIRFY